MPKRTAATLIKKIDAVFTARIKRLAADVEAKRLKAEEDKLVADLTLDMVDSGVAQMRGTEGVSITCNARTVPRVTDWAAVDKWAIENNVPAIYQRRITDSVWKEHRESGHAIPGIEAVETHALGYGKLK